MSDPNRVVPYKSLGDFELHDLEEVRLLLRGGSIIDWHRLNFGEPEHAIDFLAANEFDLTDPADLSRAEAVKNSAVSYLRRNYKFPIPKAVAQSSLPDLLMLAATRGHRGMCACTILKVMHIIHHLEARELLFMLPVSDQEVFHLVEQKVYRVIGGMLAAGLPILEFIGGRKNKDSLYTKLLSKEETIAAQIYDKVRFRIVTREKDDIFSTLNYLMRAVFPFNYVIPGESTNTLFHFRSYCDGHPRLKPFLPRVQLSPDLEDEEVWLDNRFTAPNYRVVHFVVDMPVRLPDSVIESAPPPAWGLGKVIFVQTEFQVIDRETEQANEMGEASHAAYKERQKLAVMRRLKVGLESKRAKAPPTRKSSPPKKATGRKRVSVPPGPPPKQDKKSPTDK